MTIWKVYRTANEMWQKKLHVQIVTEITTQLTEMPASTVTNGTHCLGQHVHLFKVDQSIYACFIALMCKCHIYNSTVIYSYNRQSYHRGDNESRTHLFYTLTELY
jgi:hypothetical protein